MIRFTKLLAFVYSRSFHHSKQSRLKALAKCNNPANLTERNVEGLKHSLFAVSSNV